MPNKYLDPSTASAQHDYIIYAIKDEEISSSQSSPRQRIRTTAITIGSISLVALLIGGYLLRGRRRIKSTKSKILKD